MDSTSSASKELNDEEFKLVSLISYFEINYLNMVDFLSKFLF